MSPENGDSLRIEVKKKFKYEGNLHEPGEILYLPADVAENVIEKGYGEEYEPTKEEKYEDLYRWANTLTAEQKSPKEVGTFRWSDMAEGLYRELKLGGAMVAVVGRQGTGKTDLRLNLADRLEGDGQEVYTGEWTGEDSKYDLLEYGKEFMVDSYDFPDQLARNIVKEYWDRHGGKHGPTEKVTSHFSQDLGWDMYRLISRGKEAEKKWKIIEAMPELERRIGKRTFWRKVDQYVDSRLSHADTLLIDFTDYDKSALGRLRGDLRSFREYWESTLSEFGQDANVVIFFQKELWGGNFTFGKFEVREIERPEPEEMAEFVTDRDWSVPFTKEALTSIAELADCVWRHYKKYMKRCLLESFRRTRKKSRKIWSRSG